ncbi:hypothetical protein Pan216_27730 [Planctomycetes bacterium Pan216]|uniref:Uncharacterized protein n=1 Tax=Kolteria novifilia TaxID=2527975 RepID=A0A518B4K6_9BACT|nr:hypothetical protein Pan216_27730 [Planctomycetes bacterium Pan216]
MDRVVGSPLLARPCKEAAAWTLLFLAAFGLRVSAIGLLGAHQRGVETAHHEHASIARSLALGDGFRYNFFGPDLRGDLSSHQAPLVPYLLAGSYLIFGVESPTAFAAVLAIQALVSALTAIGMGFLAKRLTGSLTVGLLTAAVATLYPPFLVGATHVQAVTWNLGWLALMVLSTEACRRGAGWGGVGLALGGIGGQLTDPILGAVALSLLGLLVVERVTRRAWRGVGAVCLIGLAIAAGVSPWLVRNRLVHGRFVPIKSTFWFVFWQGNNAISAGTDKLPVAREDARRLLRTWHPGRALSLAAEARRRSRSVNSLLSAEAIGELQALPTELERMDRFRELAWHQLGTDPWHYVGLCATRLGCWFWFDPTNPRSYLWPYRASYLALASLALLGMWRARDRWRDWLPVIVAAVVLTMVHSLIITSARFRLPMELLLVPSAGCGLASCVLWVACAARSRQISFANRMFRHSHPS